MAKNNPEEAAEAEEMWKMMNGENYTRDPLGRKFKKKAYYASEEGGEDLGNRHVAVADGAVFFDADPLTEEDLAELARLKKMLNIEEK